MSETAESIFSHLLVDALTDLLAEYGSPIMGEIRSGEVRLESTPMVAGIIGFTEARFGGFVAIQTSPAVVSSIVPAEIRAGATERVVADWIAELSNQLLGRTKNKMLRYGVSFQMSPPTAVSGLRLNISPQEANPCAWMQVETRHGTLEVLVDFRCEQEIRLDESDDSEHVAASEGDMMLF